MSPKPEALASPEIVKNGTAVVITLSCTSTSVCADIFKIQISPINKVVMFFISKYYIM